MVARQAAAVNAGPVTGEAMKRYVRALKRRDELEAALTKRRR